MSLFQDPPDEPPWVMQLVVRVEKTDPPTRTAACEAAAIAVVTLLHATDRPDWQPAIDRWTEGKIRKHCRRARGARWVDLEEVPGATVTHRGVEARALVPTPNTAIPAQAADLQLSGRELDDSDRTSDVTLPAVPAVLIAIPTDPFLPWGKAAAAAGHAAQVAWIEMNPARQNEWRAAGFPLRVVHLDPELFTGLATKAQIAITDAGFTVVEPGTVTALALWDR